MTDVTPATGDRLTAQDVRDAFDRQVNKPKNCPQQLFTPTLAPPGRAGIAVGMLDSRAFSVEGFQLASMSGDACEHPSQPCFDHLYSRSEPCPECPLLDAGNPATTTTLVTESEGYAIVSCTRTAATSSTVVMTQLSAELLRHLNRGRVRALGRDLKLSHREQQVLEMIRLGAGRETVAEILGITERTVKFHERNLLRKLGAESRADLLRVLL